MTAPVLPRVPGAVVLAATLLPLEPLSLVLTHLVRRIATRHPGLPRRLEHHARQRFMLDLTDLPFVLLLEPGPGRPRITAHRRTRLPPHDCRIAGAVAAFMEMLHGGMDGDALFFSRDLVIAGDTAAVLALRNAIDDAELDLADEVAGLGGPVAPLIRGLLRQAERIGGLPLRRRDLTVGEYR